MMVRPGSRMVGGILVLQLCGCAQFNMSPPCEKTGPGIMRQLAVPADVRPDQDRLASIMSVEGFEELDASYNARTCSAQVSGPSTRTTVTYKVTQSEGVRGWYEIQLLNNESSDVQMLIQEVRGAYVAG